MHITFGQEASGKESLEILQSRTAEGRQTAQRSKSVGHAASIAYTRENQPLFLQNGKEKKERLAQASELSAEDFQTQQNYMTLMSNTLSEEDYAKLEEEGFDPQNMEPQDTVTIVDKIKAQLVLAGQQIAGFTDDLNAETLAQALGGDVAFANSMMQELAQADVRLEADLIPKLETAWDMAQSLEVPSQGTFRYMVDNQLPPEIYEFYMAKNSGADAAVPGNAMYYSQDVNGYYAKSGDLQGLELPYEKVIQDAGLEVTEETRGEVNWLSMQGLPITAENLQNYHDLKQISFPVTRENFVKSVSSAISMGKNPVHANLAKEESVYKKAVALLDKYIQVEEIRLEMTAEVNVKLLKSGFSFETASMEEILENLHKAKEEIAKDYFPGVENPIEKYDLLQKTENIVKDIPLLPAQTAVQVRNIGEPLDITVSEFHQEGEALREQYKKLEQSYEPLMTSPRADMGDSIRKAFANVDDILQDLKFEPTEENRQAARILGYNRMEMTATNLEAVRGACNEVRDIVEKMTPAATLKMIRDGINPLEKTFEELRDYFSEADSDYEKESESYSRFLYGLEQKKDITAEERDSFIGIYRMLRMIEKGDNASVGALVNMQADLNFSNLLSATRSAKVKKLDVRINEEFGGLKELVESGTSISTQIEKAFLAGIREHLTQAVFGEKEAKEYREYLMNEARQTVENQTEQDSVLEKSGLPRTMANMQAAEELFKNAGNPFRKLGRKYRDDLVEKLDNKEVFTEEYEGLLEEAEKSAQEQSEEAEKWVDVKAMQMVHKQLTILGSLSPKEEYVIPLEIDGETQAVHLTIQSDTEQKGMVDVEIPFEEGKLQAHLEMKQEKLTGYLVGNSAQEVMISQKVADIFSDWIKEETSWSMDARLPVVGKQYRSAGTKMAAMDTNQKDIQVDNGELYKLAKGLIKAVKSAKEA